MLHALVVTLLSSSNEGVVLEPVAPVSRGEAEVCRATSDLWQNGARAQVDPLGRGVWVIDDENDEVLLVGVQATSQAGDPSVRRFSPGSWPEQLVVDPDGRVFVSARQSGQLFVIDPDLHTWVVPLAPEPKALALDLTRRRLYVGLVTAREVVALDARSGAVLKRRATFSPPDFLALSAAGLLVGSRRSEVVSTFGPDLEARAALRVEVPAFVSLGALSTGGLFAFEPQMSRFPGTPQAGRVELGVIGLAAEGTAVAIATTRAETSAAVVGSGGYGGASQPVSQFLVAGQACADGVVLGRDTPLGSTGPLIELVMKQGSIWVLADAYEFTRLEADLSRARFPGRLIARAQALAPFSSETAWVLTRGRKVLWADVPDAARSLRMGVAPRRLPALEVAQLPPSRLDAQLRSGRALFTGFDGRISELGLACVSCHPDGRDDGRTWTQEGSLRQTPMLAGRLEGTAPFNWLGTSATLEANIHQTITQRIFGSGLDQKSVAALARYLREGLRPVTTREPAAETLIARGAELFADEEVGCAHCHPPDRAFTDAKSHDVKSVGEPERRQFQGQARLPSKKMTPRSTARPAVPSRFNTPSLKSLVQTAPYLHDGSAPTLAYLLETNHDRMGVTSHLSPEERQALLAYLESL